MLQDKIKARGNVLVVMRDEKGEIVQQSEGKNLVVTAGLVEIARALIGDAFTSPTHMGVGTDNTAPDAGNTALGGELTRLIFASTTRTDNAVEFKTTYGAGVATGTIEEAALFNNAVAGDMLCRFLTGTYVKAASYVMEITWTITFNAA